MGDDVAGRLLERIAGGDQEAVAALLEPLDETERQLLLPTLAAAKDLPEHDRCGTGLCPVCRAARVAQFGIADASEAHFATPHYEPEMERLLRVRDRRFRQAVVNRPRTGGYQWSRLPWPWIYRLVRDDLVTKPKKPWYLAEGARAIEAWRHDIGWMDDEFWRLFTDEPAAIELSTNATVAQEWWFGMVDRFAAALSHGKPPVDRDRVLDECLLALRRDFRPKATHFYRELFDRLVPSLDEVAQRVGELLPLLASSNTPDVAFALRHLGSLKGAEPAPTEELLWQLSTALSLPVKRHALSALEIADTILENHPSLAYVGLPVLVEALPNQKPEVQRQTLQVIERHRAALTELDRERLLDLVPDLDRPLRGLVSLLAGAPVAKPKPRSEPVAIPPRITHTDNTPCLHLFAKLERVRGPEDFLDRWERVLEHPWDAEEIELLLDASVRLDPAEIDHDRALSIFHRGPDTSFIFGVTQPLEALQYVIAERLDLPRQRHGIPSAGDSPLEAILTRVRELLEDRPDHSQLCTPTHRGGWIDALVAAERIAFLEAPAMAMDLAQMVLRLAPDHRSEALSIVEHVEREEASILAYALGAEIDSPALPGRLAPAWSAAEHARDPSGYEPWGATPPDVAATAGRRVRELPRLGSPHPFGREPLPDVMPASPAALLDLDNVWWHSYKPGTWEQWLATVWPARRSSQYRIVTRRLWDHNGYHETDGIDRILDQLRHPREVVDDEATLALCITFSTDDVALRGLAADVTHTLLLERRLDGKGIGDALVYLLRGHPETDTERAHWQFTEHSFHLWRHSLADVAESSALGAHEIQTAIETLFADTDEQDRKRVAWLVPLLRHLVLDGDAAVVNPGARRFLEGFSRSSKTGRAARETLAVTGTGAERSHAAVAAIEIPIDPHSASDR